MTDLDAPPVFDRRAARRLAAGMATLVAVAVAAGGWVWLKSADRRRADNLLRIIHPGGSTTGRPLTDSEFDEALALVESPDRVARTAALYAAAQSAYRTVDADGRVLPVDRGGRVEAVALRRLDSADPRDQADGLHALLLAARTGQLPRARSFLTATDPLVRATATATAAHLGKVLATSVGAADAAR